MITVHPSLLSDRALGPSVASIVPGSSNVFDYTASPLTQHTSVRSFMYAKRPYYSWVQGVASPSRPVGFFLRSNINDLNKKFYLTIAGHANWFQSRQYGTKALGEASVASGIYKNVANYSDLYNIEPLLVDLIKKMEEIAGQVKLQDDGLAANTFLLDMYAELSDIHTTAKSDRLNAIKEILSTITGDENPVLCMFHYCSNYYDGFRSRNVWWSNPIRDVLDPLYYPSVNTSVHFYIIIGRSENLLSRGRTSGLDLENLSFIPYFIINF